MSLCVCGEKNRESVCSFVYERERERERKRVHVFMYECEPNGGEILVVFVYTYVYTCMRKLREIIAIRFHV